MPYSIRVALLFQKMFGQIFRDVWFVSISCLSIVCVANLCITFVFSANLLLQFSELQAIAKFTCPNEWLCYNIPCIITSRPQAALVWLWRYDFSSGQTSIPLRRKERSIKLVRYFILTAHSSITFSRMSKAGHKIFPQCDSYVRTEV